VHHPVQTSRTGKGGFRGPTIRQPIDGDLQVRVMEGLLRSWGLSMDSTRTGNRLAAGAGGWAPAAQGWPARRASPTTGDAGSEDPAYRAASRGRRTVPDACRLGLGRTVRHDPYRIGP